MKKNILKAAAITLLTLSSSSLVKAQILGDNLGNHKATKDLLMQTKQILNTSGLAIGTATFSNTSIALQIDGSDKAILIPRVATNAAIATPLNGMIIYNTTDKKFYLYQGGDNVNAGGAWTTFALAMIEATDGINATGNDHGYTLTQVGAETVLKLSAATLTMPGIVTVDTQSFGGDKTFGGKVTVTGNTEVLGTSTFTVGAGLSALGGKLTVADSVALAQSLSVAVRTKLNADSVSGGLKLDGIQTGSGILAEKFIVVDVAGNVKRSAQSPFSLDQRTVVIPTVVLPTNSAIKITITGILNLKKNDGVLVNFDADELLSNADLAFMSILNATATADGTLTITVADMRQEAEVAPFLSDAGVLLTGKHFTLTRYHLAN
ncbi:MAG: hypothetical protein EOO88_41630 [Pedobacter sp.]|nr:MAG: hypothetical protein EOO88_41630 [Pedobacter sp.]